ncbi:MAG: hypothetical protein DSZ21_00935 [Tenericutes bacterium]|nr:MAG: hypothetical protein DSZ21_00935 [Mycoplasmatota bacterium]
MIKKIVDDVFLQNSYVLEIDSKIVIIDPGYSYEDIVKYLDGKKPDLILLTHFHFDHVACVDKLCEDYGIKAYIHEAEFLIVQKDTLAELMGFSHVKVDGKNLIEFKDKIDILPSLKIINAPGHSPGSCLLIYKDAMFSGDVIFAESIGRMDFPYGDPQKMRESLRMIKKLDDCTVYPGHGPKAALSEITKLEFFRD